ncbi:sigma-54 dependent transcriptional regulator [Desulfovibrio mangrovi]|uniref:sigma-54-dependent transcriptional regulator n=1 Tax=Desulfovibrio mangrovi TaxID=2976983 RepID=UPI0022485921|nr:sigma-54 dependent transcriptional regulator [Desulfovibrio mangrovi]UZP67143.1 sigma-54 dependent transcriptional regulator [Desulfovibrio mangrovi]
MARIFVIDADPAFCESLGAIVAGLGHQAEHAQSLGIALSTPSLRNADIIFLNTALPDGNGLDTLPKLRTQPAKPEVIMITDAATADGAERAIRNGAWDYVAKQGAVDRMVLPLIRALDYRGRKPGKRGEVRLKRDSIIGGSPGLTRCLDIVSEAAASDASTLLYGETGVGKEVFARAIHDNSQRSSGPFVAVDCASLSRTLAGSTLFGHRKGAFTGADKDRDGLVAQAHRGTLFLDEVGELPLAMQKIFLRVLQEHRFRPVGGRAEITSDFRLICATNRNIEEMVSRGTFRSDLLFRMRTVVMHIPPLRERLDDLPELSAHYIRRLCGKYGMPAKSISTDLHAALKEYQWPGNVRELIHTLERAVLAAQDEPKLFSRHLPDHVRISIARAAASSITAPLPRSTDAAKSWLTVADSSDGLLPPKDMQPAPPDTFGDLGDTFTPPLRPGASCVISDTIETPESSAFEQLDRRSRTLPATNTEAHHAQQALSPHVQASQSVPADNSHSYSTISDTPADQPNLPPFFAFRDAAFLGYLTELLKQSNGDIPAACALSGLSRSYLYDLLKKYDIATPQRKRR